MSIVKNIIKFFVPKRLIKTPYNFATAKKLINSRDKFNSKARTDLTQTFDVVKLFFGPNKTISFYPWVPTPGAVIFDLCACLGYKIVIGPAKNADFEIMYHNSTYTDPKKIKPGLLNPNEALNGKCFNISKRHVQDCFKEAFGYNLGFDPTKYEGRLLKKSNLNYTHDGEIIDTPIKPGKVNKNAVYQKVVNNETEDGYFLDYRVPIYGNKIPIVYKKYRPPENRFDDISHTELISPEDAFSKREIKQILSFAKLINLDFGELDILRDNDNGMIYIVDANSTPFHSDLSDDLKKPVFDILSESFANLIADHDKKSFAKFSSDI